MAKAGETRPFARAAAVAPARNSIITHRRYFVNSFFAQIFFSEIPIFRHFDYCISGRGVVYFNHGKGRTPRGTATPGRAPRPTRATKKS